MVDFIQMWGWSDNSCHSNTSLNQYTWKGMSHTELACDELAGLSATKAQREPVLSKCGVKIHPWSRVRALKFFFNFVSHLKSFKWIILRNNAYKGTLSKTCEKISRIPAQSRPYMTAWCTWNKRRKATGKAASLNPLSFRPGLLDMSDSASRLLSVRPPPCSIISLNYADAVLLMADLSSCLRLVWLLLVYSVSAGH